MKDLLCDLLHLLHHSDSFPPPTFHFETMFRNFTLSVGATVLEMQTMLSSKEHLILKSS